MHVSRAIVALTVGTSIAVWLAACGGGSTPATPVPTAPAVAANLTGASVPGAVNPGFASTANAQSTANAATQTTQQRVYATSVAASAVTAVVRQTDAAVAVSATRQAQAAAAQGTGTAVALAGAQSRATAASAAQARAAAATLTAMPTSTPVLPAAIGQSAAVTPSAAPPEAVPLTSFRTTLLVLHANPELVTDAALLKAVTQQIQIEQQAWSFVDCFPHINGQDAQCLNTPHPGQGGLSPKRSTFVFEWQKYMATQPDFAKGPLANVFGDPQADWSFVKREADWDDSFDNLVQVFLFSRDSIRDRDPGFVARDLMPTFRQLLDTVAANQPSHYWFKVDLAAPKYDFASSTYSFSNNPASPNFNLLSATTGAGFPDETRGRANYGLNGGIQGYGVVTGEQQQVFAISASSTANGSPNGLRLRVPVDQMSTAWRTNVVSNFQVNLSSISLDHQLQLAPIKVDPALAEKLTKRNPQFQARVYLNVDHAWSFDRPLSGTSTQKESGLTASIQRVDVFALMQPLQTPGTAGSAIGGMEEQLVASFT